MSRHIATLGTLLELLIDHPFGAAERRAGSDTPTPLTWGTWRELDETERQGLKTGIFTDALMSAPGGKAVLTAILAALEKQGEIELLRAIPPVMAALNAGGEGFANPLRASYRFAHRLAVGTSSDALKLDAVLFVNGLPVVLMAEAPRAEDAAQHLLDVVGRRPTWGLYAALYVAFGEDRLLAGTTAQPVESWEEISLPDLLVALSPGTLPLLARLYARVEERIIEGQAELRRVRSPLAFVAMAERVATRALQRRGGLIVVPPGTDVQEALHTLTLRLCLGGLRPVVMPDGWRQIEALAAAFLRDLGETLFSESDSPHGAIDSGRVAVLELADATHDLDPDASLADPARRVLLATLDSEGPCDASWWMVRQNLPDAPAFTLSLLAPDVLPAETRWSRCWPGDPDGIFLDLRPKPDAVPVHVALVEGFADSEGRTTELVGILPVMTRWMRVGKRVLMLVPTMQDAARFTQAARPGLDVFDASLWEAGNDEWAAIEQARETLMVVVRDTLPRWMELSPYDAVIVMRPIQPETFTRIHRALAAPRDGRDDAAVCLAGPACPGATLLLAAYSQISHIGP